MQPLSLWIQQLARWTGLPRPLYPIVQRSSAPCFTRFSAYDSAAPTLLLWSTGARPRPVLSLIAPLFAAYGFHTVTVQGPGRLPDSALLSDSSWFDGRLAAWVWGDLPAAAQWPVPPEQIALLFQRAESAASLPFQLGERSAVHLLTSWDAPALSTTLTEYLRQLAQRRRPFLTVCPYRSGQLRQLRTALAEGLRWTAAHFGLLPPPARRAVRCALNNSREWHEMDFWPPPATLRRIPLLPTALRGVWLSPTLEHTCDLVGRPTVHQLDLVLPRAADERLDLALITEGLPARLISRADGGVSARSATDGMMPQRLDLAPTAQRLPAGSRLRLTAAQADGVSDRALELTLPLIDAAALARMREYTPVVQRRRQPETRF